VLFVTDTVIFLDEGIAMYEINRKAGTARYTANLIIGRFIM